MVLEDFLCSPHQRHHHDVNADVVFFYLCPRWRFFCSAGWSRALHTHQQWCHKPCRGIIGGIRARAWSVRLAAAVYDFTHTQRRFGSTNGATACWSERGDKTRVERPNPSTAFLPAGCLYAFPLKVGLSCWVTHRAAWLRLHARVTAEVSSLKLRAGPTALSSILSGAALSLVSAFCLLFDNFIYIKGICFWMIRGISYNIE